MNHRHIRIALTAAALGPALIMAAASPAAADHVHFRVLGTEQCVLLAPDGGEQHVQLPHAEGPENRRHPERRDGTADQGRGDRPPTIISSSTPTGATGATGPTGWYCTSARCPSGRTSVRP